MKCAAPSLHLVYSYNVAMIIINCKPSVAMIPSFASFAREKSSWYAESRCMSNILVAQQWSFRYFMVFKVMLRLEQSWQVSKERAAECIACATSVKLTGTPSKRISSMVLLIQKGQLSKRTPEPWMLLPRQLPNGPPRRVEAELIVIVVLPHSELKILRSYLFCSNIALHDWPGTNLHRQLLIELLHCEAQGTIGVHFELFSVRLERLWDAQGNSEKALWRKLSHDTYEYCIQNHIEPLPRFPTWLYWKHALSGGDKLRFFQHCPAILAPLLLDYRSIKDEWETLILHSSIVRRLCNRCIDRTELDTLEMDMKRLHNQFLTLYPQTDASLNLHYETHLVTMIKRYLSLLTNMLSKILTL